MTTTSLPGLSWFARCSQFHVRKNVLIVALLVTLAEMALSQYNVLTDMSSAALHLSVSLLCMVSLFSMKGTSLNQNFFIALAGAAVIGLSFLSFVGLIPVGNPTFPW